MSASPGRARFIVRPLVAALASAGLIAPLGAATIVVTTGGDAGNAGTCTLRQAAQSLNLATLQGTCLVASGAFGVDDRVDLTAQTGTITLTGGPILSLLSGMRFDGPGAAALTVSGGGASQVFIGPGLEINALTVANGRSVGWGGCIVADGLILQDSVVTGCVATSDPLSIYHNGLGGGIAAKYMFSYRSSIVGNTAASAGGGAFVYAGIFNQTLVSGNTVAATNCGSVDDESCLPAVLGGGGILGESVLLQGSTVSGNTVNATMLTKYDDVAMQTYDVRVGLAGGVSQLPVTLIFDGTIGPERAKSASARRTFWRHLPNPPDTAARAAVKAKVAKAGGARLKVDGQGTYILGLSHSTISGNRVIGPGGADEAKYGAGGALAFGIAYNAEIANSTISGNRLDSSRGAETYGGALVATAVDMSNSTITGNVGTTAVAMNSYAAPAPGGAAAKARPAAAKARARLEALVAKSRGQMKIGSNKVITPPVFQSTIVAGNSVGSGYQVDCTPCTIGGADNLIGSAPPGTVLPPDTLTSDPQLAPLANNGGILAGAPGHALTAPTPTHRLYFGSPALDAGNNLEGFEFEQRGNGFPRVVGPEADIGATEGAVDAPGSVPVPALAPWLVALLSALLGALGLARRRRPG
jgi:hypothetical protein